MMSYPLISRTKFLAWHSGLPSLGKVSIKPSCFTKPVKCVELHLFGDRSEEVFCAVAFLQGRVKTSLVTQVAIRLADEKARVAPMEALSISKLELQAALLATRLKEDILKALTIPVSNAFMWTESSIGKTQVVSNLRS